MKKVLFIVCAILITGFHSFGQSAEKTNLFQKSKNQKTAAWVLLGVGVALDVAGIATTFSNANKELGNLFAPTSVNHTGEYVLYIAGTAALATSITLFIAARRNKTKAALLSFKNEMAPQLQNSAVHYAPVPSLSLKIKF
jgi:hypothetical protein